MGYQSSVSNSAKPDLLISEIWVENIKEAIELYLEADPGEIGRPAGEYKVCEVAL